MPRPTSAASTSTSCSPATLPTSPPGSTTDPPDLLHHRLAAAAVTDAGGMEALLRWHEAMAALASTQPGTVRLATTPGDVDSTYADLLRTLGPTSGRPDTQVAPPA